MKPLKFIGMLGICSLLPTFLLPNPWCHSGDRFAGQNANGTAAVEYEPVPHCPDAAEPDDHRPTRTGRSHAILAGFAGETDWIHAREGHAGRPYWPDGASGVTLDPGIDLGHADPRLIDTAYRGRLSRSQWRAVRRATGVRGLEAEAQLRSSRTLRSIRISRDRAADIFPHLLGPYWNQLKRRFPALEGPEVPPMVQTALLSLAYNRGAWNPDLAPLGKAVESHDWHAAAEIIRHMQQDHVLDGIRRRRRVEGLLISRSLKPEVSTSLCRPS